MSLTLRPASFWGAGWQREVIEENCGGTLRAAPPEKNPLLIPLMLQLPPPRKRLTVPLCPNLGPHCLLTRVTAAACYAQPAACGAVFLGPNSTASATCRRHRDAILWPHLPGMWFPTHWEILHLPRFTVVQFVLYYGPLADTNLSAEQHLAPPSTADKDGYHTPLSQVLSSCY